MKPYKTHVAAHAEYRPTDYRFQRTLKRDGIPLVRSEPLRNFYWSFAIGVALVVASYAMWLGFAFLIGQRP